MSDKTTAALAAEQADAEATTTQEADVWRLRLTSSAARQTSPPSSSVSSRAPCTAARTSRL